MQPPELRNRNALWRCTAVLSQWLLIWWLTVTLGFVGLRVALDDSRDTLGSWPPSYLRFLSQVVRGDLGTSAHDGHSVLEIAALGLPVDLLLTGGALLAAWIIGTVWGLLAAVRADGVLAAWLMQLARGFVSVSVVVMVTLGVLFVSATERWSMLVGGASLWLPMLALAVPHAAEVARGTHAQALAALASESVFMARATGLPRQRIWLRHVVPVAWLRAPSSRLPLASVFTSVIVIENLLGAAGTGRFFVTAARQQDYAVAVGLGIVYSTLLIAASLVADLVREWQASATASNTAPARETA